MSATAATFGDRIRDLREARGWTQMELAEKARTTQASVSRFERAVAMRGTASVVRRIAGALDLSFEELTGAEAKRTMARTPSESLRAHGVAHAHLRALLNLTVGRVGFHADDVLAVNAALDADAKAAAACLPIDNEERLRARMLDLLGAAKCRRERGEASPACLADLLCDALDHARGQR